MEVVLKRNVIEISLDLNREEINSLIFRSVLFEHSARTQVHLRASLLPRLLQQHRRVFVMFRPWLSLTKDIMGGWHLRTGGDDEEMIFRLIFSFLFRLSGQFLVCGTSWIMEPSSSRHFLPRTWSLASTNRNPCVSPLSISLNIFCHSDQKYFSCCCSDHPNHHKYF